MEYVGVFYLVFLYLRNKAGKSCIFRATKKELLRESLSSDVADGL